MVQAWVMLRGEAEQMARLAGGAAELIGRARDKSALLALTSGTSLVTVTGLPGVGKTALSLAVAAASTRSYRDGAWPVPLGQLKEPLLVPHTVAQALGVPDHLSRDRLGALTSELAERRMLLLLDTCEHLADGCADLVAAIARDCPHITVLSTSRRPLGVPGETVYTLRPLTLGHAIVLFGKRARQAAPDFHVTLDNRTAIADICRRLDRLPLAIELAVRQLASVSLTELSDDLDTGLGLLHNGVDAPGRHQTMSAAIGWSHQLCSPAERLLWARLTVFTEPFQLNDASGVCADDNLPPAAIAVALTGLANQSLLLTDAPNGTEPVYRLPETIRAYGSAMLLRLGEESAVHARYRMWRAHRR
jgi:predicted ATPase